jgi:G protein-coupled receptor Mth (Methuselah protein)
MIAFQFCFLHAFFWMNVLSFDIFQTFRNVMVNNREIASGTANNHKKKRLAIYTMYAVGVPLIISVITVIVEFVEISQGSLTEKIKPYFGRRKCFFDPSQKLSAFIFFYLPLLLIQVSNVGFFIATIIKLRHTWRQSRRVRVNSVPQSQLEHFKIAAKIFLIMGITWFFEILSFMLEWKWDNEKPKVIFYFNDCINLLQGVLLFVVLICKSKILKKLRQRLTNGGESRGTSNNAGVKSDDGSSDRKASVSTGSTNMTPEDKRRVSIELKQITPNSADEL